MYDEMYCHVFSHMTNLKDPLISLVSVGLETRVGTEYYYDNKERQLGGYLCQYTLEGSGILYYDGKNHVVSKGQAIFIPIPSDTIYRCNTASRDKWQFIFIHFQSRHLAEYYNNIYEKNGYIINLPIDSIPVKFMYNILNQTKAGHITNYNKASSLAYEFLCKLHDYFCDNSESYSLRNKEIVALLESNYSSLDGITGIAEKFHISASHMTREFTREVGITPIKYLTKVRINEAKKLLHKTNMSVTQIAKECGYEQTNYFCKVFHKNVGQTPLQYRDYMG